MRYTVVAGGVLLGVLGAFVRAMRADAFRCSVSPPPGGNVGTRPTDIYITGFLSPPQ